MWNRVVGQIGQAWNQNYPLTNEQEETGVNGVSSTQSTGAEGDTVAVTPDVELTTEQYRQVILAKDSEVSSVHTKYDTLYSKFKSLQSSYETDLQAERSVIEALKEQIMERDKEQTDAATKAESKFSRLKQQARTRINELSREIDALKLGQEADGKTNYAQEKIDESFTGSPSSSRAGSPDRLQLELCEKESELESVQQELATMRQNSIELESQLSDLQQQITQLQPIKKELKTSLASVDRVEQENVQLNTSIQELTHRNSLLNSRINEVIEERKQSEENLDQFKKFKLKEFQEVIHNKSDEIEALNNSQSLLRLEYIDEKQTREQQESQLSSLREEKELSRQRYQQLVLQVEGYTREIEQLRAATGREENPELSNDATQLDDLKLEVSELRDQLRDSREETEMKREDILSKDCELNSQEEKLEEALLKNDKLSEDIEDYANLLSGCKLEIDRISSLYTELIDTVNGLRKEVEEAETLINVSQTDLSTCTEELQREQCHNIETQSQLEEANIREIFSQERISYLESSVCKNEDNTNSQQVYISQETEENTQKLKDENQILNEKFEIAEKDLSLLKAQNDKQSKEFERLNTLNSNLTNEKLGLEDRLTTKLAGNVSLQSAVTSQNEEIALKCSEVDNLNKSISSLRDENEIMRDQNSSVQSELEQIVGQLNAATDNNRQLTNKLNTRERDALLAQESNSTLQERLTLLERELREKEGERVELESLRENSASTGALEHQLYSSQEECKQLKLKNSERLLSIESLSTENKQIKSALDKSTQSLNAMRLSLDTANSGNNKLASDIDRITRENNKLNSNINSLLDDLSQLRDDLKRKDSELSSLLKTTQAASSEMNLLRDSLAARDRECSGLREQNSLLGDDAKRMQEGFDSALELIQSKLERSEGRVSELERRSRETESAAKEIREEREIARTQNIQLREQLTFIRESQRNQQSLLPENERLHILATEQTAQLTAAQSELESLQQDNAVLRSAQESTMSGVHEREGRSLQLSQDIAELSRENEQSHRKLNEVTKLLELVEFERDQLRKENAGFNESSAQLQTLQLQLQHVTVELNALKENLSLERESWERQRSELSQQTDPVCSPSPPEQGEVPTATKYYIAQLEERLQNVVYAQGQELQSLRETLEMEKLKSSQMEEALNRSAPSDGLPLPATAISEDFSCLNQSTMSECVNVLKHQLVRWRANPKIALTRFLKSRPLPQVLLTAYFLSLHLIILISLL